MVTSPARRRAHAAAAPFRAPHRERIAARSPDPRTDRHRGRADGDRGRRGELGGAARPDGPSGWDGGGGPTSPPGGSSPGSSSMSSPGRRMSWRARRPLRMSRIHQIPRKRSDTTMITMPTDDDGRRPHGVPGVGQRQRLVRGHHHHVEGEHPRGTGLDRDPKRGHRSVEDHVADLRGPTLHPARPVRRPEGSEIELGAVQQRDAHGAAGGRRTGRSGAAWP